MLQVTQSPVPCISISFAPNESLISLPNSPFGAHLAKEPDSPRPQCLIPAPTMSPNRLHQRHISLSPLSPPHPSGGKGLERARFEAMLQASKERSAMVGAKKPPALRKEIAVKAQKAKQLERRARFLNKLAAPPSPSAADLPVTPPDSPAIFHFTLPSPGLESPLELFENILDHPELYENMKRIEQVDFRFPHQNQAETDSSHHFAAPTANGSSLLPSLDQISRRMNKGPVSFSTTLSPSPEQRGRGNSRLPSFLRSEATPPPKDQPSERSRPVPPRLTLRTENLPGHVMIRTPTPWGPLFPQLPPSPKSPQRVELRITTIICPPTRSKSSPTEFSEKNVTQFGSEQSGVVISKPTVSTVTEGRHIPSRRAQVTMDMFNKLSRRTPGLPNAAACGIKARDDIALTLPHGAEDKLRRRISAPPEMPVAERGNRHPVLEKQGGF